MLSRQHDLHYSSYNVEQLSELIMANIEQGINASDILFGLSKHGCNVGSLLHFSERFSVDSGVIFEGYVAGCHSDKYHQLIKTEHVDFAEIAYYLAKNGHIEEIEAIIGQHKEDAILFKLKQGMAEGGYVDYLMHYEEIFCGSDHEEKVLFLKKLTANLHIKQAEKYRAAYNLKNEIILNGLVSHANAYGILGVIKKINSDEQLSKLYIDLLKESLQSSTENVRFPQAGDYVLSDHQTLNELLSHCNPACANDGAFHGIAKKVLDELIIKNSLRPSDVNQYLLPALSAFYMVEKSKNSSDLSKVVFSRLKDYLNLEGYIEFGDEEASYKHYPDLLAKKILELIDQEEFSSCKEHLAVQIRTYCGRYGFIMGDDSISQFIQHASKHIKKRLSDNVQNLKIQIQNIKVQLEEININLATFKQLSKKKDKTEEDLRNISEAKSQLGNNNKLSKQLNRKLSRLNIKSLITDGINDSLFEGLNTKLTANNLINKDTILKLNLVGYRKNISKKLRRLNSLARLLSMEIPVSAFKYKPKIVNRRKNNATSDEKILNNCVAVTIYNGNLFVATNSVLDKRSEIALRDKLNVRLDSLSILFNELDRSINKEKSKQIIQRYISDHFDKMMPVMKKTRIAKDIFKLYQSRGELAWKNHYIDISISEKLAYHAEQVLADKFIDVRTPVFIGIEKICCHACYQHLEKLNVVFSGGSNGRYGGLAFGEDKSGDLPLRIAVHPEHEESASESSLMGAKEHVFSADLRASSSSTLFRESLSNSFTLFDITNRRRQRNGAASRSAPCTLTGKIYSKSGIK